MPDYKSPITGAPLPRGKPFKAGTEAREYGRKGGASSGRRRKELRSLREELLLLLAEERPDKDGNIITVQKGITASLVAKAAKGDVKAWELIRDTIGQKPVEKVEVHSPDFSELDGILEGMKKNDEA